MASDRFELVNGNGYRYWLTRDGDALLLCGGSGDASDRQVLGRLERGRLRDLLLWAGGEDRVVAVMEGPMANETKKAAKELGISEQMIVWNALKIFLDVGGGAE